MKTTYNNDAIKHLSKSDFKKWFKKTYPKANKDEVNEHYNAIHGKEESPIVD